MAKASIEFSDLKAKVEAYATEAGASGALGKILGALGFKGRYEVLEGRDNGKVFRAYIFHGVSGIAPKLLILTAGPNHAPRLEVQGARDHISPGVYFAGSPSPRQQEKLTGTLVKGGKAAPGGRRAVKQAVEAAIDAEAVVEAAAAAAPAMQPLVPTPRRGGLRAPRAAAMHKRAGEPGLYEAPRPYSYGPEQLHEPEPPPPPRAPRAPRTPKPRAAPAGSGGSAQLQAAMSGIANLAALLGGGD